MIERRVSKSGRVSYRAKVKSGRALVASKTFDRKKDAETWEREQARALAFGTFVAPADSARPFGSVVTEFLETRKGQVSDHTWRTDKDNLAATPASWQRRPVASVREPDILRWLTAELTMKARSTVQRSRTSLSALFAFAIRERLVNSNPVKAVPLPAGIGVEADDPTATFSEEEFAAALSAQRNLSPWLADVIEFISLTGLRWGECRALLTSDVQEVPYPAIRVARSHSDGYARKSTKTGNIRFVPLTDRAMELVRPRLNRDGLLFTSITGLQLRGNLLRRQLKWSETARGRTIHQIRHFCISRWLRAGIPVNQVSRWAGHANPSTTLRVYAHVLGEQQERDALAVLNGGPMGAPRKSALQKQIQTPEGGREETPAQPVEMCGDEGI